jgi:hypothetical protein
MNKTMPASRTTPFLATASECQTPDVGFPGDFQDLCSFAMDQALAVERASEATVVSLNSCAIDLYKSSLSFAPAFSDLLDIVAQTLAFSMELQMYWLTLLAPHASSQVASSSGSQAQATGDELAHTMEVAIGERLRAPSSTVTSVSSGQAQPNKKEEVPESGMYIAMRARA